MFARDTIRNPPKSGRGPNDTYHVRRGPAALSRMYLSMHTYSLWVINTCRWLLTSSVCEANCRFGREQISRDRAVELAAFIKELAGDFFGVRTPSGASTA